MTKWLNLVELYELSLQKKEQEPIVWESIREKIVEKIHSIVENRWIDLIYLLWNKDIPFENLDSELHKELSKKYPYDYAEALLTNWIYSIWWLSTYWYVLRNIINNLKNIVDEKEYIETITNIFILIPDLKEIPIYDIWLTKKNLWCEMFEKLMNNRTIKEQNYIYESLQRYPI